MRTLGYRTHVLMALAAAAGLVYTLALPWYAAAPREKSEQSIGDISGPLDGFFQGFERWATETAGTNAWDALDAFAIAIAAMSGAAAFGALLCLVPLFQSFGREVLRYTALAAFGLAFWRLVDQPGANAATELRYGAFAALAVASVLLSSALGVVNAPLRRRKPQVAYTPPPAPVYESASPVSTTGSVAPPGT